MVFKRYFIARLLPVLLLLLLSPATSPAKTLVGVIMTGDIPYYRAMHQAFVATVEKTLPAGEDVEFILQRPFPDPIAWSNAARKLIAIEVDLIVSYGSPATQAVLLEKSKIPVVYAGVYDPQAANISGATVTGCGYKVPLSSLLRYFKRVRDMKKLQIVYSSTEEDSVRQMTELATLAKQQKVKHSKVDIRSHGDLRKFKGIARDDAVYVTGSSLVHVWIEDILEQLWDKRIPAVDIFPDTDELGMLITLFQPPEQQGKKAAEIVSKIIDGEQVNNIPPELLRTTELVFNLDEANHLGITFPMQLIVEATRVIK
jgi:putative ABC transport system substrate-binding protein